VLVVDTSAVVAALVGRPPNQALVDRLRADGDLHAPHATFVALAEALNVPLVTCDARLAGAPGSSAVVELYEGAEG
jgi:predicted nucleic acid-binding protein